MLHGSVVCLSVCVSDSEEVGVRAALGEEILRQLRIIVATMQSIYTVVC